MRACFHSDQNLRARTQKSLSNADTLGLGCLREGVHYERGRIERPRLSGVQWLSCEGAIAFRLWTATLYLIEITGRQNFGERHG